MSRSQKRQETRQYRAPRGHKHAKKHGLRKVPPGQFDDVIPDNQCFKVQKIIRKLFNNGMGLEEIESKIRSDYKIPYWQWTELTKYDFEPTIEFHFEDMVAINGNETEIISLSTPEAEPCFVVRCEDLPIDNYLIIKGNKLLRHKTKEIVEKLFHAYKTIEVNEIYPFPNEKLTKILVYLLDHYVENGMLYWYTVSKWQMGLDRCEIEYQDYEK